MITKVVGETNCVGCAACAAKCPLNAISMIESEKGFSVPVVEETICIKCGQCVNVCPQYNEPILHTEPEIYALKHKNDSVRMRSTSGGAFSVFSDTILSKKGVIYGAAYNSDWSVSHVRTETYDGRNEMRGSKYVKSHIKEKIYKSVKEDLNEGKNVLYTGCPCQIASLLAYLEKEYSNLYTIDLVCHGTPSNLLWLEFLKEIEKRTKRSIGKVQFRSKARGWSESELRIYDKKGWLFPTHLSRCWTKFFLNHYAHSSACFNCKYCKYERISDITIADYWGIKKTHPDFYDEKGVSLVFVNSTKGKSLFEQSTKEMEFVKSNYEACAQEHLVNPPRKPDNYDEFWEDFKHHGIAYVMRNYYKVDLCRYYVKRFIKNIFKHNNLYIR